MNEQEQKSSLLQNLMVGVRITFPGDMEPSSIAERIVTLAEDLHIKMQKRGFLPPELAKPE